MNLVPKDDIDAEQQFKRSRRLAVITLVIVGIAVGASSTALFLQHQDHGRIVRIERHQHHHPHPADQGGGSQQSPQATQQPNPPAGGGQGNTGGSTQPPGTHTPNPPEPGPGPAPEPTPNPTILEGACNIVNNLGIPLC